MDRLINNLQVLWRTERALAVDGLELEGGHVDEDVAILNAMHQGLHTLQVELQLRQPLSRRRIEHRIDGLLDAARDADAVPALKALHALFQLGIERL